MTEYGFSYPKIMPEDIIGQKEVQALLDAGYKIVPNDEPEAE